jgi:spore maturation protein CgeB
MRIVLLCHSLVSDWNHGNAHFLRGVVSELLDRGHAVDVYEPLDGWSRANLVADHGRNAVVDFHCAFPQLRSRTYDLDDLDVPAMTAGADLVIAHEWTEPTVVRACGRQRAAGGYRLLFHDTHHRMVTAPEEMGRFELDEYDGVLAFGGVIRDLYLGRSMTDRAWIWHEAADMRVFRPSAAPEGVTGDLVWIGNWGDGERTAELHQFLLDPVAHLGLRARAHGVRYPADARRALAAAGIDYAGWLPNHLVPRSYAEHRVTVHVPRRPYVEALPGIPTIRPFEAMACGIPLVSAPWDDCEHLFRPGVDHLVAPTPAAMERMLDEVLHDPQLSAALTTAGLETIAARHTCAHRVDELMQICAELGLDAHVTEPRGST